MAKARCYVFHIHLPTHSIKTRGGIGPPWSTNLLLDIIKVSPARFPSYPNLFPLLPPFSSIPIRGIIKTRPRNKCVPSLPPLWKRGREMASVPVAVSSQSLRIHRDLHPLFVHLPFVRFSPRLPSTLYPSFSTSANSRCAKTSERADAIKSSVAKPSTDTVIREVIN